MAEHKTRCLNMAGTWWLPNTDNEMLGTLRWTPNVGCILELVGDSHEFKWGDTLSIVWGLNSDQDPISLVGCRYVGGGTIKSRGNATSFGHRIAASYALVGGLFENEAEIALTDLYVGFAGLDEYVIERYYDFEPKQDADGRYKFGPITFSIPEYDSAKIDETRVGIFVSFSLGQQLQLQHKLHVVFPNRDGYSSDGDNYQLVHEMLPAFLSAMMGHKSFLTSNSSHIDNVSVEVFDGYHERISWDGNPKFRDRLVLGKEKTLALWPAILPAWVENYQAVSKLCSAYVKILSDGTDGFFEVNNLVHLFFGLERYYKEKRNKTHSSLWRALKYTICRIDSYFENIDTFIQVADSIDIGYLNDARNTLVHSNEGEPDYSLVFRQLMFITRCVLLMEMEYPVANIQQETQHWDLWQSFSKGRK